MYRPISINVAISSSDTYYMSLSTNFDYTGNSTVLGSAAMLADGFIIFWRAKDLSAFDTEYAYSLATALHISFTPTSSQRLTAATASTRGLSGTTSIPRQTNPGAGQSSDSSHTLSTGAKAGISVGAVLGVALLAGLLFLAIAWHRRRRSQHGHNPEYERNSDQVPELVQVRVPVSHG